MSADFRFPLPRPRISALVRSAKLRHDLSVAQIAADALHKLGLDTELAAVDVEVAEYRFNQPEELADGDAEYDLTLLECTQSWFAKAVALHPEFSDEARIAHLMSESNEKAFDSEWGSYYSMMMACLAQLSDERMTRVLSDYGLQDGVGSQVTLDEVRKWSGRQAEYGGLIRGAWVNNLFYDGLLQPAPPTVTEERTRDAISRIGASGFCQTYEAAAAWVADRIMGIMPTRVENAVAFLRALEELKPLAPTRSTLRPPDVTHLLSPGAAAIWSTATRIHHATVVMSTAISSARQPFAAAADSLGETPCAPRRRQPAI